MSGPATIGDQSEWHSIRLRVLGLTGIAVDPTTTTTGGGGGEAATTPSPTPKHVRAVVAVTRDAVGYGCSGPSRRLVKVPKHEHFVAIWGGTSRLQPLHNKKNDAAAVIEFETAFEPRLRRSLHRNFELVIGVTSSSSRQQPTPIGAASLPLQQAVALRSRETGKIVLDLPVFSLPSMKHDPFADAAAAAAVGANCEAVATTATEEASSATTLERIGGLFRSRSLRRPRTGVTVSSGGANTNVGAPSSSPSEAVSSKQCPFRMDSTPDAAILRIELEIEALPTNVVLVQPQDDAIETAHSLDRKSSSKSGPGVGGASVSSSSTSLSSSKKKQYRVKIVDQSTMDSEVGPVLGRSFATEEDDELPPTLASSSADSSSVFENKYRRLFISPVAVERVLSDEEARYDVAPAMIHLQHDKNNSHNKPSVPAMDDTSHTIFGVETPLGGDVDNLGRRPPSLAFRQRLLSKSFSSASRGSTARRPTAGGDAANLETERCQSPASEVSCSHKAPLGHGEESSSPCRESSALVAERTTVRSLPVVIDNYKQTAAPETFEPVHFSPGKPTDTIQFALAMNMINAPPPARKKSEGNEESIPMGTILEAAAVGTNSERSVLPEPTTGLVATIQRGLTKHWRDMFTVAEEDETDFGPEEEETLETYDPPVIVDLVAVFGDMCRPTHPNALDESLTEAPGWIDDDEQDEDDDDDDIGDADEDDDVDMDDDDGADDDDDDDESDFSELFTVSKSPALRQSYLLPVRKRRSFVNHRRGNSNNGALQGDALLLPTALSLTTRQRMAIMAASASNHQQQQPSMRPKSVLKNGRVVSPIQRAIQEEETFDEADKSPDRVTPPSEAARETTTPPRQQMLTRSFYSTMAQNLVDYVATAITPLPSPPEAAVPVPAVFLQTGGRDAVSVGDLTATSHEIQVEMEKYKKLIQDHLDQAARDKKEYIIGNEIVFQSSSEDGDDVDEEQSDDQQAVDSKEQQDDVGSNSSDWEA